MQCFDFILPVHDNAGSFMSIEIKDFRARCLFEAGGYTNCPNVTGAWVDDTGTKFYDESFIVRVACHEDIKTRLLAYAFELWPDQKTVAIIKHGDMTIYDSHR